MKKLASVALAAFAALLVTLAYSSAAQAYPDVTVTLTASKQVVSAGETLTVTASANVPCTWSESWNNEGRASAGSRFVTTYVAPQVTQITKLSLTATCSYAAPGGSARAVPQTWDKDLTVTVLPTASSAAATPRGSSDLPSTGGPSQVWVVGGFMLLLAGASAVVLARRRAEAELAEEAAAEPLSTMGSLL